MRLNLQKLVKITSVCFFFVFLFAAAYPSYTVYAAPSLVLQHNYPIIVLKNSAGTNAVELAKPAISPVFINGNKTEFEAYNIRGYNYFKLRDIAFALNGTEKQFEVGYNNSSKIISLTTGKAYTVTGGELKKGGGKAKEAFFNSSEIYLDGISVWLDAYTIDGYNFFKLRDLGEQLDFAIVYDEAAKSVSIDTANESPNFVTNEFIQSNYRENQDTQKNISGLINDQNSSPVSDIKMGFYESDNNGCGWIATYNAMYLLGEPQPPADIVKYYETAGGTVLNGLFGTNPFTVYQYFKDMGFETGYASPPSKMDKDIADADVAVLEYTNVPYLHYVAVYYENGIYTIYNSGGTESGKPVETASIDRWIEERGYAPLVLITVIPTELNNTPQQNTNK